MIISNFKIDQKLVYIFSHFGVVLAIFFGGSKIYFEVKLYNWKKKQWFGLFSVVVSSTMHWIIDIKNLWYSKVMRYSYLMHSNLVTFFVKISEIAMATLTNMHFLLVESQVFLVNIGWTWSFSKFWKFTQIYFDNSFCFICNVWKIVHGIEIRLDL